MHQKLSNSSAKLSVIREVDEYNCVSDSKLRLGSPIPHNVAVSPRAQITNIYSQ
jgi:hypothetical protein